jgi:hypothetical protein
VTTEQLDGQKLGARKLRWALIVGLILALAALAMVEAPRQDWTTIGLGCRKGGVGKTPAAAIHDYYDGCIRQPTLETLEPYDSPYEPYAESAEFRVKTEHRLRFVIVGRKKGSRLWRVDAQGEGTGP